VVGEIVSQSKSIHFTEQYQVDEFLGEPFRRMVVSHYKIIYKIHSETEIRILQIFDTRQNLINIRKP
jgi:plasmid stabilization system protein ParE